jgi:AcrR family transcriptional regulator
LVETTGREPGAGDKLRDQRRRATRLRLLKEGRRLFSENGMENVSAAQVAAAAGVTERTFFRHFPSKTDLFLADWERIAAALVAAISAQPAHALPIEVVRAGLRAFAAERAELIESDPVQAMAMYAGQPVLPMLQVVISLEASLSKELGRRLGMSDEDRRIRTVANASIAVLRACGRAYLLGDRDLPLPEMASQGLDQLAPLFAQLTPPDQPAQANKADGRPNRKTSKRASRPTTRTAP